MTKQRLAVWGLGLLIVNSAYIAAFPAPTIFYMANVVLHLVLGLALMGLAVVLAKRYPRQCGAFLLCGLPAIYLAVAGNTLQHRWALWLHILLALATLLLLLWGSQSWLPPAFSRRLPFALLLLLLPTSTYLYRALRPPAPIRNPASPPLVRFPPRAHI